MPAASLGQGLLPGRFEGRGQLETVVRHAPGIGFGERPLAGKRLCHG